MPTSRIPDARRAATAQPEAVVLSILARTVPGVTHVDLHPAVRCAAAGETTRGAGTKVP